MYAQQSAVSCTECAPLASCVLFAAIALDRVSVLACKACLWASLCRRLRFDIRLAPGPPPSSESHGGVVSTPTSSAPAAAAIITVV